MSNNPKPNAGNEPEDPELFITLLLDKADNEEKDGKHEVEFTVKVTDAKKKPKNKQDVTLFGGENADIKLGEKETTLGNGSASFTVKVEPGKHKFQARLEDGTLSSPIKRKIGEGDGGGGGTPVGKGDIESELLYETVATYEPDGFTVKTPATKTYGLVITFPDKNLKGVKGVDGVSGFCKKGKNVKIVSKQMTKVNGADKEVLVEGRGPHKIVKGYCTVEVTVESRINVLEFQLNGFSNSNEKILAGPKAVPTKASKANNRRWYMLCALTVVVFFVALALSFAPKIPTTADNPPKENLYKELYGVEGPEQLIALRAKGENMEKKGENPEAPTPAPATNLSVSSKFDSFGPTSKVVWVWVIFVLLLLAIPVYGVIAFREEVQELIHELELKVMLSKDDKKSEAEVTQFKEIENKASRIHQWLKFIAKVVGVDLSIEAVLGFLTHKKQGV